VKLGSLIFLGAVSFIAQPALAQSPQGAPTSASKTSTVSVDNLLAAGFEVKAVTVLTDAMTKELYPGQTLQTQVVITLQKGSSVAVCTLATANWTSLPDSTMTNTSLCSKR
jgi:hypothetical protein